MGEPGMSRLGRRNMDAASGGQCDSLAPLSAVDAEERFRKTMAEEDELVDLLRERKPRGRQARMAVPRSKCLVPRGT